jgi:hypothetical protein
MGGVTQHSSTLRARGPECTWTRVTARISTYGSQRAEVERLVSLGARVVEWDYPENADFVVLADPSGNLFCIVNVAE